jgi:WD40 repeat protein
MLLVFSPMSLAQSVVELAGHQGAVTGIAYTSDGKQLVSSSFDRTIRLWDVATKAETKNFAGHTDMVLSVTARMDLRQLLSGSRDQRGKLWNTGSIEPLRNIGPLAAGSDLTITADQKNLVSLGADGIVRLFAVDSGAPAGEFKAHDAPVRAITWLPDQSTIFTIGDDQDLKAWKGWTGELIGRLKIGPVSPGTLALLADGSSILTVDPMGNRTAWGLPIGHRRPLTGATADVVRLLQSGGRLVSLNADGTIHVHDVASGNEERVINPGAMTKAWALSPANADLLLLAGEDKSLRTYRVSDGALLAARGELPEIATAVLFGTMDQSVVWADASGAIRRIPYPFVVEYDEQAIDAHAGPLVAVSRGTKSNATLSASTDRTVTLRDAARNPIRSFALLAPVRQAALAPTEDRLAAVGADNVLRLWLENGAEQKVIAGVVGGIAFSPDGKWLAFGGADNKAFVLPTDLSAEPKPVATHGGVVRTIVFSPSGQQIATGGADNAIKWSDIAAGTEIRSLAGHQGPINSLTISIDGKLLASGSDDKTVRVWNAETGGLIATLSEATGPITTLAYANDNSTLAVGAADNIVRIYRNNSLRASVPAQAPSSLVFSADAHQWLLGRDDGKLHIMTERTPATIAQHIAPVRSMALSADNMTLVAGGDDNLVRSWEWTTGKPLRAFAHGAAVTLMKLSPDGTRFVSAEASGKLRIGILASGEILGPVEGSSPVQSLSWSPDGNSWLATSADGVVRQISSAGAILEQSTFAGVNDSIFVDSNGARAFAGKEKSLSIEPNPKRWQAATSAQVIELFGSPAGLVSVLSDGIIEVRDSAGAMKLSVTLPPAIDAVLSADGSLVDVVSNDQKIRRVTLADGKIAGESAPSPTPIHSIARSADGTNLATRLADGSTLLWSTAAGSLPIPTRSVPSPGSIGPTLFAGPSLVTLSADNLVRLYPPIGPEVIDLVGHQGGVFGVAFSVDGTQAATASADGTVAIWQTTDGTRKQQLKGHKGTVYSVAFSADGSKLLSAGADKEVILWDGAAGTEIRRLVGASEQLYQVAFLPGDKQVIAAGVDRVVRIWDIETGNVVQSLEGHSDEIYGLSIRPDGAKLATAGNSGQVIVWDKASSQKVFDTKIGGEAYTVSYRPDGQQLAVGSANGKVYLIDLPDGVK